MSLKGLHSTKARAERSLLAIQALNDSLVHPIITPRFVPACSEDLLRGLGDLAEKYGVRVQTHCSESDWEHEHVLERFGVSDTQMLHQCGLLRPHSVLAHATHLTPTDVELIRQTGAGLAHCPLSNAYFAGAVLPVTRLLECGVHIGLGSDVAGGCHPGMLAQCAAAVTSSRMLASGVDPTRPATERGVPGSSLSLLAAFHMVTVGAAEVLGLPVGLLAPGRQFDAIAVDLRAPRSLLVVWDPSNGPHRTLERIVRLAGPTDITHVWVAGRRVV